MTPLGGTVDKLLETIKTLTLEEKASLLSGRDAWNTEEIERLGTGYVRMSDGPCGLRCVDVGDDKKEHARPSTAFPAISLAACSFDRELLYEFGSALAEESRENGVDLLLGPGVNLKRSPLCGRNFEYFSEDPLVAGELGAAYVKGLQDAGVGATLKHFALNNQEKARLCSSSVADERARRELYLAPFETVVKKAQPWAVMCAYNKVDGEYCSENPTLFRDILRNEWGFDGLVMSDWGAVCDRRAGLKAGLDLEMPGNEGLNDRVLTKAVTEGALPESFLDESARRVLALAKKARAAKNIPHTPETSEARHERARRIAARSMVLLKNEGGLLPLASGEQLAVLGEYAHTPRFQGGGSANVKAERVSTFLGELETASKDFTFLPVYNAQSGEAESGALAEAAEAARSKSAAVVFAGTPASWECEGYDRPHLRLPETQNELIARVAAENPNTVVVLFAAGPLEMPWIESVSAVLFCYLPGQAGAAAVADVLFGRVSPDGRLAETFPLKLSDTPCFPYFGEEHVALYRESLFVGYRYYDSAKIPVLFPFGHGLSYTEFLYEGLSVSRSGPTEAKLCFTLKNIGAHAAFETVQVYVAPPKSVVFHPVQELRAFEKVFLQPGEQKRLELTLGERAFSFYNPLLHGWQVLGGAYELRVGASSRDVRLTGSVELAATHPDAPLPDFKKAAPEYYDPKRIQSVSDESFAAVLGRPLPRHSMRPFTRNSTLQEISATWTGKKINALVRKIALGAPPPEGEQDLSAMLEGQAPYLPIFSLVSGTKGALSYEILDGLLLVMNGRPLRGAAKVVKNFFFNKSKKEQKDA